MTRRHCTHGTLSGAWPPRAHLLANDSNAGHPPRLPDVPRVCLRAARRICPRRGAVRRHQRLHAGPRNIHFPPQHPCGWSGRYAVFMTYPPECAFALDTSVMFSHNTAVGLARSMFFLGPQPGWCGHGHLHGQRLQPAERPAGRGTGASDRPRPPCQGSSGCCCPTRPCHPSTFINKTSPC